MVGGKDLIAARLDEIRTDIAGSGIRMYDQSGSFGLTDAEPLDFSDLAAGFDADTDIICQPTRSRSLKKPLAVPGHSATDRCRWLRSPQTCTCPIWIRRLNRARMRWRNDEPSR